MKSLITNYLFNAAQRKVTFSGYTSVVAEAVLLITNVTDGVIIYNFADPLKTGTVAANVLTLTFDTGSMSNGDDLQIWYDDPAVVASTTAGQDDGNQILSVLKQIRTLLESNAVVDSKRRQRVTIEALGTNNAAASTEVNAALPVTVSSGTVNLSSIVTVGTGGGQAITVSAPFAVGTPTYHAVWEGPVDQRWRVAEAARQSFALGVRSNITFS